ncbi:hypothetical protein K3495_g1820 [Podosphaera aphanis]|nr:hypothetical protein K3495_g1820 [Podosphaera aphanis]
MICAIVFTFCLSGILANPHSLSKRLVKSINIRATITCPDQQVYQREHVKFAENEAKKQEQILAPYKYLFLVGINAGNGRIYSSDPGPHLLYPLERELAFRGDRHDYIVLGKSNHAIAVTTFGHGIFVLCSIMDPDSDTESWVCSTYLHLNEPRAPRKVNANPDVIEFMESVDKLPVIIGFNAA